MAYRVVTVDDIAAVPWKNGGGVTRELFAFPSSSNWDFRISVANINQSGPFSCFPGIERHFAVLEGPGVDLIFSSGEKTRVSPSNDDHSCSSSVLKFSGEDGPMCNLDRDCVLVRDLNVMVRRSKGTGSLIPVDIQNPLHVFVSNAEKKNSVCAMFALHAVHLTIEKKHKLPSGQHDCGESSTTIDVPPMSMVLCVQNQLHSDAGYCDELWTVRLLNKEEQQTSSCFWITYATND